MNQTKTNAKSKTATKTKSKATPRAKAPVKSKTKAKPQRTNKWYVPSFIVVLIGLGLIGLCFVYYADLIPGFGIRDCSTLTTLEQFNTTNCGDGDFGGAFLLLFGMPIALIGVVMLAVSEGYSRLNKK